VHRHYSRTIPQTVNFAIRIFRADHKIRSIFLPMKYFLLKILKYQLQKIIDYSIFSAQTFYFYYLSTTLLMKHSAE